MTTNNNQAQSQCTNASLSQSLPWLEKLIPNTQTSLQDVVTVLSSENIKKCVIPITNIKTWAIRDSWLLQWGHQPHIESNVIFDDGHNKFILNFFLKHSNKIEKLMVELQERSVTDKIFTNCLKFNQSIALTLENERKHIDG